MSSMIYLFDSSGSFSQITAAALISEFLSVQLSAWLMSFSSPWIPYLGSSSIFTIGLKFHWTFAQHDKAAFVISLRAGGNLRVLTILLPALSEFLARRAQLDRAARDKRASQISVITVILGHLLIFVADSPVELSAGVILSALVSAFTVTARSTLSSLIDQKYLATVYTGLSVMAYSGVVAGGPLLASSFRWGMKLGGFWMGLPFIVAADLYHLAENQSVTYSESINRAMTDIIACRVLNSYIHITEDSLEQIFMTMFKVF
uniref:Uncharacterized protein n=1 Tax=Talaromyces marneffei PM1 TaxID=1077442 RepID=A0A093ULI6_TALMA